jgi:hypothetical protein
MNWLDFLGHAVGIFSQYQHEKDWRQADVCHNNLYYGLMCVDNERLSGSVLCCIQLSYKEWVKKLMIKCW